MIKRSLSFLIFFLFIFGPAPHAQNLSYDRYAPVWPDGPLKNPPSKAADTLQSFGKHFLVYPFEMVRWPIDQTLLAVEEYHLYDKADWIYDQMKNHGFTPKIRSLFGGDSFGGGFEIEAFKLARLKETFPHSTLKASALWTFDNITDYKMEVLQEEIGGSAFRLGGNFRYEDRGKEYFYGLGPTTSLGDGTSYRVERTTVGSTLGYAFWGTWDLRALFSFQNVNIGDGDDGRRGIIDDIFVRQRGQNISGLAGDEILSWGTELEHDNRDNRDLPTEGGYERLHFSYQKGLENSTGYFKYRAEAAHFFKVHSDRRIFGIRGIVEHNDEVGGRDVPFFQMARLGGYGTYPRIGDTHRGFKRDRFYDESLILFNGEYRWNILEYRDWRLDPVLYCDFGQVFGEWSQFQFDDFAFSYGLGFRVSYEKDIVLTVDVARSRDGMEVYVKTRAPF